jgi:hypothetical protein
VTARTSPASAVRRTDMRSPPECVVVTRRYGLLRRRGFGAADEGMSSIDGAEPVIVTPTS